MPDRTSRWRSVKLVLAPSQTGSGQATWALVLEVVRGGVPHASVVERGVVPLEGATPPLGEIWEAIHNVAGCLTALHPDEITP